jgi:predicted MFS family arabinose efflux permease
LIPLSYPADRSRTLFFLAGLASFNQLDRQLMNLMLEPIRKEFGASDLQLGILSGVVFALVYSFCSLGAAAWVVRHSRKNLLIAATLVWGAMTALCGLAQTFVQLLFARAGIGLGEAGGPPPSHAMISDLYRPHERASAMSAWHAGNNIGLCVALLAGGYAAQHFGWRTALIAAGLLTMACALVLLLFVREPERMSDAGTPALAALGAGTTISETAVLITRDRALFHLAIAAGMTAVVALGAVAWLPSFLVRTHGMQIASVGLYLALVVGIGGAAGNYIGGRFSDYLRARDIRWSLWLVTCTILITKPLIIASYLAGELRRVLGLLVLPAIVGGVFYGPSIAALHNRVPAASRAIASALLLLMVNVIGLSLGPLLTGALSDALAGAYGRDSLRYSLAIMQLLGVWHAIHFYFAGRALAVRA